MFTYVKHDLRINRKIKIILSENYKQFLKTLLTEVVIRAIVRLYVFLED